MIGLEGVNMELVWIGLGLVLGVIGAVAVGFFVVLKIMLEYPGR